MTDAELRLSLALDLAMTPALAVPVLLVLLAVATVAVGWLIASAVALPMGFALAFVTGDD
jgi:hypothetical protein